MIMVVTVLLLLIIIISLTRVGRRQLDHIHDRHDSADPRGPAWAARGSTVDEADPVRGAGASKLAGCPDWNEFADEALRVFVEHRKFSHAQLDQVKTLSHTDVDRVFHR